MTVAHALTPARLIRFGMALSLFLVPASTQAQQTRALLDGGVRAYGNLDYDAAVGLLRQALSRTDTNALTTTNRSRALTYLAAAEFFRGGQDSAAAAFRRLVISDPRYRPDQLIFPPEVLSVYQAERLRTKAVAVTVPPQTQLQIGRESFTMQAYASSFHDVTAELTRVDGSAMRTVYRGPIGDSLQLRWDGRDVAGEAVPTGSYLLAIASRDAQGRTLRVVQVPLDIERQQRDTLPHPPSLPDSLFLPEKSPHAPGIESLMGGLLVGAAVAILPKALAPGSELTGARYVVAGGISLAGIAGFLTHYPGRPMARNVESNRLRRQQFNEQSESVRLENIERRRDARLTITARPAVVVQQAEP